MDVVQEVQNEVNRQFELWGEQNHPDGTGREEQRQTADTFKSLMKTWAQDDSLTFRDILFEEVLEAYAETDDGALRTELIQVAAVAVTWIQAIDRRRARAWNTADSSTCSS